MTRGMMVFSVVMIGLFWGLNWPAVKFMLTEVGPFTIRAVALSFAASLMAGFALITGRRLLPPMNELPWMALTGLMSVFGFNVLVALGQVLTETSKAAIIAYTMPALTAIFSAVLLSERLSARRILALSIGMAGLAVLASENLGALLADPRGPLIMLGAATVWAGGTVAMKAGRFTLSPISLTVWFLGLSAVACWPFALIFEGGFTMPSGPVIAVWIWHAALPMVVCYALWVNLVGRMPASLAAIATLLAPVVGVSSSVLLLGDPLTWQKALALALVLTSIVLALGGRARS